MKNRRVIRNQKDNGSPRNNERHRADHQRNKCLYAHHHRSVQRLTLSPLDGEMEPPLLECITFGEIISVPLLPRFAGIRIRDGRKGPKARHDKRQDKRHDVDGKKDLKVHVRQLNKVSHDINISDADNRECR